MMEDFIKYVKSIDDRLKKLENQSIIKNLKIPNTGSFVLPVMASAPASPVIGQMYFDSVLSVARVWDGSTWQDLY